MSPAVNRNLIELPTDGSLSHNWMYSYLPIGQRNEPVLLGFCKQCRHQFVYYIPVQPVQGKHYYEYDTKVPRYGCVPVEDI